MNFCVCLGQHSSDNALEKSRGWHDGKLIDPHPGYLGRSPQYWVLHLLSIDMYALMFELASPLLWALLCC